MVFAVLEVPRQANLLLWSLIGCYSMWNSFLVGNHSDSPFLCERGEGSWRRGEESTFEGVTLSL